MKIKPIVIGLAACFSIIAFLGHFWKNFIITNHIDDLHLGQYLYGAVFLLTTYFISNLFATTDAKLRDLLIIVAIGVAFSALYGDVYKTTGSVCMGIILICLQILTKRIRK